MSTPGMGLSFAPYPGSNRRPAGHEFWMHSPWKNASLTGNAVLVPIFNDPLISGAVLLTDMLSLEPSKGLYDLTWLRKQLDTAQAAGKGIIVRIVLKQYAGLYTDVAGQPPLTPVIPRYITDDPATYGGEPLRGGLYRVNQGAGNVGWGLNLTNDAARARVKALVAEIARQLGSHPALRGVIVPDESLLSCWTPAGLPPGITGDSIAFAFRDLCAYVAGLFGTARSWPVVNGVDCTDGSWQAIQRCSDLQGWVCGSGHNLGCSDTDLAPTWGLQASYYGLPRKDLAPGRRMLVHIDHRSLPPDDALLPQGMVALIQQTYWMMGGNPGITAINPNPVGSGGTPAGSPNYWAAIKAAIAVAT